MRFSERMARLGTETAFEVLARARALEAKGKQVIHLEIGEPDFDTPEYIVQAGIDALNNGAHHYGPSPGLPEFRQALAAYMTKRTGVHVVPEQVVVTPGGKPVMFYVMLALLDPGDEVIYPNPGYPIYESMTMYLGAKPVPIRLIEENNFDLDVDQLLSSITDRTRLIIINTPHNPTGGMLSEASMRAIAKAAAAREIPVLSDEIYGRITYDEPFTSMLTFDGMNEHCIVLDGFSKIYAMTGWRLGFGVMRPDLAAAVSKLQTNCASCTATFTQLAGKVAIEGSQQDCENMVREFHRRRDYIVERLNNIPGISCVMPRGAFYVFPNIKKTGYKSVELADKLLEEAGVACLSGTTFGSWGEGYIRFSYANSLENIAKAMDSVEKLMSK